MQMSIESTSFQLKLVFKLQLKNSCLVKMFNNFSLVELLDPV